MFAVYAFLSLSLQLPTHAIFQLLMRVKFNTMMKKNIFHFLIIISNAENTRRIFLLTKKQHAMQSNLFSSPTHTSSLGTLEDDICCCQGLEGRVGGTFRLSRLI